MKFYLLRIMTAQVKGPCFRNYVISASDIISARNYACQVFGSECVGSVECVESLSLLPRDSEWLE